MTPDEIADGLEDKDELASIGCYFCNSVQEPLNWVTLNDDGFTRSYFLCQYCREGVKQLIVPDPPSVQESVADGLEDEDDLGSLALKLEAARIKPVNIQGEWKLFDAGWASVYRNRPNPNQMGDVTQATMEKLNIERIEEYNDNVYGRVVRVISPLGTAYYNPRNEFWLDVCTIDELL